MANRPFVSCPRWLKKRFFLSIISTTTFSYCSQATFFYKYSPISLSSSSRNPMISQASLSHSSIIPSPIEKTHLSVFLTRGGIFHYMNAVFASVSARGYKGLSIILFHIPDHFPTSRHINTLCLEFVLHVVAASVGPSKYSITSTISLRPVFRALVVLPDIQLQSAIRILP